MVRLDNGLLMWVWSEVCVGCKGLFVLSVVVVSVVSKDDLWFALG